MFTQAQHRRALSLLELIIAVLAMGIIAVAGSLRFTDSLVRFRLNSAAKVIATDLQSLSTLARTRSQPVTVIFDPTAETYTVQGVANPDGRSRPYAVDVSVQFKVQIDRADFINATPLIFNAFGHPNRSGIIVLKSGTEERLIILDMTQGSLSVP